LRRKVSFDRRNEHAVKSANAYGGNLYCTVLPQCHGNSSHEYDNYVNSCDFHAKLFCVIFLLVNMISRWFVPLKKDLGDELQHLVFYAVVAVIIVTIVVRYD
jgi:hypothetical protein